MSNLSNAIGLPVRYVELRTQFLGEGLLIRRHYKSSRIYNLKLDRYPQAFAVLQSYRYILSVVVELYSNAFHITLSTRSARTYSGSDRNSAPPPNAENPMTPLVLWVDEPYARKGFCHDFFRSCHRHEILYRDENSRHKCPLFRVLLVLALSSKKRKKFRSTTVTGNRQSVSQSVIQTSR